MNLHLFFIFIKWVERSNIDYSFIINCIQNKMFQYLEIFAGVGWLYIWFKQF